MSELDEIMEGKHEIKHLRIEGDTIAFETELNNYTWNLTPRNIEIIIYCLQQENQQLKEENKQLKVKSEVLEENNKLLIQQKQQMYEDLDIAYEKIDKAIDKLYCYGEVFDSKILQQFQREMIEILGDKENE